MVNEETGRVVDKENKGRGYEVSKGKYVEIEPGVANPPPR
jgi:DNA end-binding protein Ku